jgi:hypothetical protein
MASLEAAARTHAQSQFDAGALELELRERSDIIDGWLRWVEDKHWSPAWYFSAADDGRYVVGFFSTEESQRTQAFFNDQYSACAAFIIHELEDYQSLRQSKGTW